MKGERSASRLLGEIIDAARRHGDVSERDHEVGDLQDALRAAWVLLTDAQRAALHAAHFEGHEHWVAEAAELQ